MPAKSKQTSLNIAQWLVLGPFPMSDRTPGRWLTNGYACESDFAPSAREAFDGRAWKTYNGEHLDFHAADLGFDQREWAFAYAFTYIRSTKQQTVQLRIHSDDGVALWLNGACVHANDRQRGLGEGVDHVKVTLRAGWNGLLVKVSQGIGGWAMKLALASTRVGGAAPNVTPGLKRPSQKQFPGLSQRKAGLSPAGEPSRVTVTAAQNDFVCRLGLRVFNDGAAPAGRIRLALIDKKGKAHATATAKQLKPFTSETLTVEVDGQTLLPLLSRATPLQLQVTSGAGDLTVDLPKELAARIFFMLMTGFDLPADPDTTLAVPPVFRGIPARIELRSAHEHMLFRDVEWPKHPARTATAGETEGGEITVSLKAPAALPHPIARVTFGEPPLQELIEKLRFLLTELGADPAAALDDCRHGLHALSEGDFTAAAASLCEAYTALARTQPDRGDQTVILAGHAHIDMNWLWVTTETIQCCHDSFRQVLTFMDEYSDFHFSQSMISIYRYVEQIDPDMFERIRDCVAQGRWELLGGAITEGDTNLSSGEGIARTMLYGQRYFQSRFGKTAVVGWLPDNFGHVAQLPQLLQLAGMGYFYGHRCQPKMGPYVWEGIDGSRVLNYASVTYNGEVNPHLRLMPEQYDPAHKKMLWIYGVGDHGGGPTRRDMARVRAYNELPGFPRLRFGTAEEYFHEIEGNQEDYPVHKGELQYVFEGCYTSIARVKQGNRDCENTLYGAELLSALLSLDGFAYPSQALYDAWYRVTYNQFHDILCGSATFESNRESIGWYDDALAKAGEIRYSALRALAARVPTRDDLGQPLVVFNPLPRPRNEVVEAEIFAHIPPPTAHLPHWGFWESQQTLDVVDVGQGPYPTLRLLDQDGEPVEAQIVAGKLFPNGYRMKVRFLARDVPGCGYRVYYSTPEEPGERPTQRINVKGTTIETDYLRVSVDPKTGCLTQVFDKRRRTDVLPHNAKANLLRIDMEQPHPMSAWDLGPISESFELLTPESVEVVEQGPVRAAIRVRHTWNRSTFTQTIYVHRDQPRVDFDLDVRWFELGGRDVDAPTLRVSFPVAVSKGTFTCDTPHAAVERPTTGREVPAQKWIDLSDRKGGAALLNDGKYGHRCDGNVLETTLLRASYEPDLYPDQGPHHMRYCLLPHQGDWIAAELMDEGLAFNTPMLAIETPPGQEGDLPPSTGLVSIEPENVFLSAVKQAEDGEGLVIRVFEGHGQPTEAVIRLHRPAASVVRVDLLENDQRAVEPASGVEETIRLPLRAHEIASLRVLF